MAGTPEPLAVWDCNERGGLWWRNMGEASDWAVAHFQGNAWRTDRAEFYLIDIPFVILFMLKENDGNFYVDPSTGELAREAPLTMILRELPPKHLLME